MNTELQLAEKFVYETGCNIFLTGKAGTGKTTFLETLKKDSPKRMVITAPTGVAAINAGGVTLHSFFQLPFGPIVPDAASSTVQYRYSKKKIDIIKSLDLLIIDEISMVRADLLDGIDTILRRFRHSALPFGGVQLLMIGDLHQLPPVAKSHEWQLLQRYYASPYFFSSIALAKTETLTIELQHIYRQTDLHFIELLNRVRNDALDSRSLAKLNERVIHDFSPGDDEGYITLCTHNRNGDLINNRKLNELSAPAFSFEADIEGDFPEQNYPAAARLTLKKGAQVMFIRNDLSPEKRFFNGKIGTVTHITTDSIRVKCATDGEIIEVEPTTWENIEYSLNEETQEISEKTIGAFNQFPLRLAWAITIHKSQGLTFDKAIIDAQAAFAHGQVYVALSRCRTLEGLVLSAPILPQTVKTDASVLNFSSQAHNNRPDQTRFQNARVKYQQRLLLECFDFEQLRSLLYRLTSLLQGNKDIIKVSGLGDLAEMRQKTTDEICTVGKNFQRELERLFQQRVVPAEDPVILERIKKASDYFRHKIETLLAPLQNGMLVDTDNKELRKRCEKTTQKLEEEISIKLAAACCCADGFSPSAYFRAVSGAALSRTKPKKKDREALYSEKDITHPDLFLTLKKWRSRKAEEENIAHFQVLHQKTLIQLVINLPDSITALKKIRGIGPKLALKYGDELVEMISRYRKENAITEVVLPEAQSPPQSREKEKTAPPADTREETLKLHRQGYSPKEIAKQRHLTPATIEKHLAGHIENGAIAITALIPQERSVSLARQIATMQDCSKKEMKEQLPPETSYGEISFVLAHLKYLASTGRTQ
ncbi:MAG: helix-turn-helix domain-containing protein [Desulfopila sp.]|nr:helix-turn-helix domain-containing protein [Desulfopila sp.]